MPRVVLTLVNLPYLRGCVPRDDRGAAHAAGDARTAPVRAALTRISKLYDQIAANIRGHTGAVSHCRARRLSRSGARTASSGWLRCIVWPRHRRSHRRRGVQVVACRRCRQRKRTPKRLTGAVRGDRREPYRDRSCRDRRGRAFATIWPRDRVWLRAGWARRGIIYRPQVPNLRPDADRLSRCRQSIGPVAQFQQKLAGATDRDRTTGLRGRSPSRHSRSLHQRPGTRSRHWYLGDISHAPY